MKKILSITTALALCLTAAACEMPGNSGSGGTDNIASGPAVEQLSTQTGLSAGIISAHMKHPGYKESYVVLENQITLNRDYGDGSLGRIPLLSGLKDKSVQDAVNMELRKMADRGADWTEMPAYRGAEIIKRRIVSTDDPNASVFDYASFNNLLSMACFGSMVAYDSSGNSIYFDKTETATFDLRTGRKLRLSDLLTDTEKGLDYINAQVEEYIRDNHLAEEAVDDDFYSLMNFKLSGRFTGIREDQKFVLNGISDRSVSLVIDYCNPEFDTDFSSDFIPVSLGPYSRIAEYAEGENIYEAEAPSLMLIGSLYQEEEQCGADDYESNFRGLPVDYYHDVYYYEGMPAEQVGYAVLSDEKLDAELESLNAAVERASLDQPGSGPRGFISSYTYCTPAGPYVNISRTFRSELRADGDYLTEKYETASYCFREKGTVPLELSDVFAPGADCRSLIKEAMKKELRANTEISPTEEQIEKLTETAVSRISGFRVMAKYLLFDFSTNVGNLVSETVELGPGEYDWMYAAAIETVEYKNIGIDNLSIFE